MVTFGLSFASMLEPSIVGGDAGRSLPSLGESIRGGWESWVSVGSGPEPDVSAFAVSRGAGGGKGGFPIALRSLEAALGLAFIPARVSPRP
jgi:hypothetical protein